MPLRGKAASKGHTLDDSTSTTKEQSHRRGEQRREPEAEKGTAASGDLVLELVHLEKIPGVTRDGLGRTKHIHKEFKIEHKHFNCLKRDFL